jgi:hypothetical protein
MAAQVLPSAANQLTTAASSGSDHQKKETHCTSFQALTACTFLSGDN